MTKNAKWHIETVILLDDSNSLAFLRPNEWKPYQFKHFNVAIDYGVKKIWYHEGFGEKPYHCSISRKRLIYRRATVI